MKRQLAALGLFALAFGMLQLPACGFDFNALFGQHDRNNDGYWNYREFNNANTYYYRSHPQEVIIDRGHLRRDFDRLDTDHDGYVNMDEVRTYRNWE